MLNAGKWKVYWMSFRQDSDRVDKQLHQILMHQSEYLWSQIQLSIHQTENYLWCTFLLNDYYFFSRKNMKILNTAVLIYFTFGVSTSAIITIILQVNFVKLN